MGIFNPSTAPTQVSPGEYLMFDEGLIMSSGNPSDFCGQDSTQNSKNWFLEGGGGDDSLATLVQDRYV